jgi:hypothetical protein
MEFTRQDRAQTTVILRIKNGVQSWAPHVGIYQKHDRTGLSQADG